MINRPYKFIPFPSVNNANADGLLVAGGDLSMDTLLSAYQQGIFPWYNDTQPILWWSPNPRMVLMPDEIHYSHSLKKSLRKKKFNVCCNRDFEQVINACAGERINQSGGTWINGEMQQAYIELNRKGYACSIECWENNKLAGGLYGVNLGYAFFGESMFSNATDTSKIALAHLCMFLQQYPGSFIDCQIESSHLSSLGAKNIPRDDFLAMLEENTKPNKNIDWHKFDSYCEQLVF